MASRTATILLTLAALSGFAANSILCRMALRSGQDIDPATFTTARILSGALTLAFLATLKRNGSLEGAGNWLSAGALFAYAIAFSLAYVRLTTGTGALILFGVVQVTMISAALYAGERPNPAQWAGLVLALGGLLALTWPGLTAPDPAGAFLMTVAGIAWGMYSLRGRASGRPLIDTAGNFIRAVPLAVLVSLISIASASASRTGLLLAVASGSLASGIGYSFWYTVLPRLTSSRAAVIQLSVPVLAAAAGVALLGEPVTSRLLLTGFIILSGILLAITAKVESRDRE